MTKRFFSISTHILILIILIEAMFVLVSPGLAQTVQTWSEPINLSNSGAATSPSMIVDSQGGLHVFWIDRFEGYTYVESPDGSTWTSPATTNFPFSLKQTIAPVFLADPNGWLHIFWLGEKNDLFYSKALNENFGSPTAWQTRSNLESGVLEFDAYLDAQGRLHLGYVKNPVPTGDGTNAPSPTVISEPAGVFYQFSVDGGNSWTPRTSLYESAYFRSLSPENARISLAAEGEKVYAVWDDQPQKRIFMATSEDGGLSWNPAKELITPQASLGFGTPYHADIDASPERLLLTWQVGEPGVQCRPYSSVSTDGGVNWAEPAQILEGFSGCPDTSEHLAMDPAYSVVLFTLQGNLSISAWNGTQWSNPESQTGPASITNPATFDAVTLGCQQAQAYDGQLFVVGCDQNGGSDIWFITRQLDPMENLFPQPSAWSNDANVTAVRETITSLVSIPDTANQVHSLWVRSSSSTSPSDPRIEYARWDGVKWTKAAPVITDLAGLPRNLTLQMDSHQRLLLSWINETTGELVFSWANSAQANLPVEWFPPVVISSPAPLTDSPEMLVDASDRILIAYAITLNEKRGIYVIQSADLGVTWSAPVQVFDASAANWDKVDQPKLAVTQDGKLHILFTQYALQGSQRAVGLHYSQSLDGGFTWTAPQMVNTTPVEWSELLAFKETLHRFWQELDGSAISTYHQVSPDGGLTWNPPAALRSDIAVMSEPSVSLDGNGNVHFLQITRDDVYTLQEWDWSTERAQLVETRKLALPTETSDVTIDNGVTPQGTIYALIQSKSPLSNAEDETSLFSVSRSLQLTEATQPFVASVATPSSLAVSPADPALQVTATLTGPLVPFDNPGSERFKNIVGLILIVLVVLFVLFLTLPRRSKAAKLEQTK